MELHMEHHMGLYFVSEVLLQNIHVIQYIVLGASEKHTAKVCQWSRCCLQITWRFSLG